VFTQQITECLPGILGDEFALRDAGALYCKEDHDVLEKSSQSSLTSSSVESNNNISSSNNNNTNLSNNNHSSELGSMSGECGFWPLILTLDLAPFLGHDLKGFRICLLTITTLYLGFFKLGMLHCLRFQLTV